MDVDGVLPADTLLLAITTHGSIPTDPKTGKILTFRIPQGMTVTKLSATPIGVCNMASPDDTDDMVKTITKIFSNPDPNLTFEQRLNTAVVALNPLQKKIVSEIVKSQNRAQPKDVQIYDFLTYADKSQSLKTYTEGQEIINKDYDVNEGEGVGAARDYKMIMLNDPLQEDLLQMMMTGRVGMATRADKMNEDQSTNLLDVVEYVKKELGVKHLVLFDYSCSVFYDTNQRDTRYLRRDAEAQGFNGGKRRHKKKTETRRRRKTRHNGYSKARTLKVSRRK